MATDSTSQVMDGNYVAPWPNQAKDFDPANSDDKFHDMIVLLQVFRVKVTTNTAFFSEDNGVDMMLADSCSQESTCRCFATIVI